MSDTVSNPRVERLEAYYANRQGWHSPKPDPREGHYQDLNAVPWYASMIFEERISYLDWIIARRQAEIDAWNAAQDPSDLLAQFKITEHHLMLESVKNQRRVELADREPLPESQRGPDNYPNYLDSQRWKRRRQRKLVSTGGRCEVPNCKAAAVECHHPSYDNVGFEENGDLVALCAGHHRATHRR